MKRRIALSAAAAVFACSIAAMAGNTTFFTSVGDQVFPISPPTSGGSVAGAIDNMIIGATTPKAGTFTTINTTGGGTLTPDEIDANAATLPINGQAAAQGGSVTVKGGTSSTSGNAGGAANVTGGTPGATGVGGAAAVAAGPGGATSGNGGVASLTGGAGTAGNGVGGVARVVGGAGQGSGNGGASQLTGGAAGATGTGGAAQVTGGAATAGVGGAATVAAGASAGGTNNGADVNLNPSAAVSTGIPGTVKVNGDANLMCASYYFTGTPAATNQVFFIANRPLLLTSLSEVHSTAAGGTSTLDVTKDTATGAPASGSALGQAAFNLNATANTVQNATPTATVATKTLAAGDRLAVKFNNAIQSSVGVVVTACLAPL